MVQFNGGDASSVFRKRVISMYNAITLVVTSQTSFAIYKSSPKIEIGEVYLPKAQGSNALFTLSR